MTDLRDILDSATGEHAAPTPDVVRDDLARGRRALVRRRWVRTSAVAVGAAAAVAAAVVTPGIGSIVGGDSKDAVQVAAPATNPGVPLVPFDGGATPKPISPGVVPQGWTVSGNEFALVISAPGDTTSPDDYRGKLVVYVDQDNVPDESLPRTHEVAVGDRTGYAIRADKAALQVWVPQPDGTALRAQAPPALGWDEATLGTFLGSVTVSAAAQAGVG